MGCCFCLAVGLGFYCVYGCFLFVNSVVYFNSLSGVFLNIYLAIICVLVVAYCCGFSFLFVALIWCLLAC